jgi:Tfp pilus assembly ATPase PilU
MIVFEGRTGKSKQLAWLLKDGYSHKKPLIINTVGPFIFADTGYEQIVFSSNEIMRQSVTAELLKTTIRQNGYMVIVFEVNDEPSMIDWYLTIELLLLTECIVTIQNNELEDVSVYELESDI